MTLLLLCKYGRSSWHRFDSSTLERPETEWLQVDAEPFFKTRENRTVESCVTFV